MMSNNIQIGISLDLINRHFQEPNRNRYESKYYWDELYTLIAAAGFRGIEIPYDLFWMFRGGTGVPMTRYCVEAKFGTVEGYRAHLRSCGLERIAGVHFDPTMFMRNSNLDFYFGASGHFADEAVHYAVEAGCDYINITPTPPVGLVRHYHPVNDTDQAQFDDQFLTRTGDLIRRLSDTASQNGIRLTLRHEYWSMLRGDRMHSFLAQLDDGVKIDVDAAHIAISGEEPATVCAALGDKVGSAHLTDTAFVDDAEIWKTVLPEFPQHRATQVFRDPGQGNVDLGRFYRALTGIGFCGWAVASCRQTRDPMRALLRSRDVIDNTIQAA